MDNQAKVQTFCSIGNDGEWWHVPGLHNAADQATRMDYNANFSSSDSAWFKGPSYLNKSVKQWPIDRDFALRKEMCTPDVEICKIYSGKIHEM